MDLACVRPTQQVKVQVNWKCIHLSILCSILASKKSWSFTKCRQYNEKIFMAFEKVFMCISRCLCCFGSYCVFSMTHMNYESRSHSKDNTRWLFANL